MKARADSYTPPRSDPGLETEYVLLYANPSVTPDELKKWLGDHLLPDKDGRKIVPDDYLRLYANIEVRREDWAMLEGMVLIKKSQDVTEAEKLALIRDYQTYLDNAAAKGKALTPDEKVQLAQNLLNPPQRNWISNALAVVLGGWAGDTYSEQAEKARKEGRVIGVEEQVEAFVPEGKKPPKATKKTEEIIIRDDFTNYFKSIPEEMRKVGNEWWASYKGVKYRRVGDTWEYWDGKVWQKTKKLR
jgi:hypothetical protein